jgi:hypothetical protein
MRTPLRLLVLLAHVGVILALSAHAQETLCAPATPEQTTAVVEYARIEGRPCLSPRVVRGQFEEADLVQAQHAWLNEQYPGWTLLRQSLVLPLAPEFRAPGDRAPGDDQGKQDLLEILTADGKEISICFSLSLPKGAAGKKE